MNNVYNTRNRTRERIQAPLTIINNTHSSKELSQSSVSSIRSVAVLPYNLPLQEEALKQPQVLGELSMVALAEPPLQPRHNQHPSLFFLIFIFCDKPSVSNRMARDDLGEEVDFAHHAP